MIKKTVFERNLLQADSYDVECGSNKKRFAANEKSSVGEWVKNIWENSFFAEPAYVYANIGWGCDHILLCKYERV